METKKEEYPIVHVNCRRGGNKATEGQVCPSKRAYNLSKQGDKHVAFKCVDCKYEWIVPVGGDFQL
jgi:transposase-like protein